MPYKDPEKQKAAKRKYYRRKYAEDPDFVEAERQRKLAHYEANREDRLPQMRAYSQEWYAKIEKKRRKARKNPAPARKRPLAKKAAAKVARKVARKVVAKKVSKAKPAPIRRARPAAKAVRARPLPTRKKVALARRRR